MYHTHFSLLLWTGENHTVRMLVYHKYGKSQGVVCELFRETEKMLLRKQSSI
ncbi:hypothetical protein RUMCAL_01577 [Ruminococcus callidus ATCC 27760]|uniref:Uncharacterized protein n=1 Tax=Ruminococcus callidus ATCC 27760 TaxID=411473 RepID=U2KTZ3_9FIRM|nr:hypothetical protein RUMCAL_01577 [Ruminococcus callidus ATCC 27760]